MADSVLSILSKLDPISDKLVWRPLSEDEIQALEAVVGVPMPSCLREYFHAVGLFQDLTAYGTSEYEILDRSDQFRESRQLLVKNFGQSAANLFPFAGNGAGDVIAVAEESSEGMLFFADHTTLEIRQIGSFYVWLSSVVEAALKNDRPANSEKKWCVQFSFRMQSPASIVAVMRELRPVNLGEWSKPKVSPSNVHSSEAPLIFGEEQLILKRSDYHTWEQPMFSLDYSEPVHLSLSDSLIRKLDTAFRATNLPYKLLDYGPLSLRWAEKKETHQPSAAPASARLWKWLTRRL